MVKILDVSICVVLYRAEDGTQRFHNDLMASLIGYSGWELLYYDNSPTDFLRNVVLDSSKECKICYIHDRSNLGFSYANNYLILIAQKKVILLLNPDVYGFTPATWDLIKTLDVRSCAVFAKLLNPDGTHQDCVGEVTSISRIFKKNRSMQHISKPTEVGMGIMAFMLTEKLVFAKVGLLDCDYKLYAEDMDWCYRAMLHGIHLIYNPRIVLTHTGGASSSNRWDRKATLIRKYQAEIIFIDKHFHNIAWVVMRLINLIKQLRTQFSK